MSKSQNGITRRDFLAKGTASLGTLASLSTLARAVAAQPGGQRKVIHIMGYSHIDAAWLWPWRDGSDEALNTFRSALNRMASCAGPSSQMPSNRRVTESHMPIFGGNSLQR